MLNAKNQDAQIRLTTSPEPFLIINIFLKLKRLKCQNFFKKNYVETNKQKKKKRSSLSDLDKEKKKNETFWWQAKSLFLTSDSNSLRSQFTKTKRKRIEMKKTNQIRQLEPGSHNLCSSWLLITQTEKPPKLPSKKKDIYIYIYPHESDSRTNEKFTKKFEDFRDESSVFLFIVFFFYNSSPSHTNEQRH